MNKLTKKQKGFVKDYVITDNATQAIINNHPNVKDRIVAKSMGSENLSKPYIAEAVKVMEKSLADRIPNDLLEQVHLEGLRASKEVWKNNNESGEIEKVSEEPDYGVRHKYLDSGYKLKGSYAPDKHITITIKPIDPTDIKIIEALKIIDENA